MQLGLRRPPRDDGEHNNQPKNVGLAEEDHERQFDWD